MPQSNFVVIEHKAKRAGLHWDIRFEIPKSHNWASFACRKTPPTEMGVRIMAVRTHDHSEKEALFTGTIESGYGAGTLKTWDKGKCEIIKYSPGKHIVVDFKGGKLKGVYHFLSTKVLKKGAHTGKKGESYMFFKGKIK